MQVAILQHEAGESAGFFETAFRERGATYRSIHLYENGEVPEIPESHLLLMGGSMSVHDEKDFPFLREEKILLRKRWKEWKPVLGICLGAQLIANAFGARVYPDLREVGWHLFSRAPGDNIPLFPATFHAFQLHKDTFDIPVGGTRLCTGTQVENQALSLETALGLQFHLEMTDSLIRAWVQDLDRKERKRILTETPNYLKSSNDLCRKIVDYFLCLGSRTTVKHSHG